MAFKMKRTPIKGRLDNFFSSLGKKATSDRQTKQKASNTGEYAGMTNFEKRRAEKKSRKPGESKFKADSRRMQEKRRAEKKASNTKTTRTGAGELNKPTNKEVEVKTKNNLTLGSSKNKNIEAPKSEYGYFLEDAGGNPNLAMSIMANQDNILNDGYFGVNKKGKKDILGISDIVKTRVKGKNVPQTFKQAFAAARKAGKKEFTWKGNPYTTKLAKSNSKQDVSKPKGRRAR